jgi:hypothetical protein
MVALAYGIPGTPASRSSPGPSLPVALGSSRGALLERPGGLTVDLRPSKRVTSVTMSHGDDRTNSMREVGR